MTRTRIIAAGAAAAVLVAVAFGGWYFFIRDDAPPAVNLEDAVASLTDATATATGTETATAASSTPEPSATAATSDPATATATEDDPTQAPDGLAGEWTVAAGSESFVGYRVDEELASIGATTAVGRTSDVSATLSFDGSTITAVSIEANVAALRSDDDRRDRALQRQALETGSFPTATFVLTEPIVLDSEPAEGVPVSVTAVGDLTLHGVTRSVTIPLEGQLASGLVVVVGSTEIEFADYDIDPPSALAVVSVADHGTMEFQLIFEPA